MQLCCVCVHPLFEHYSIGLRAFWQSLLGQLPCVIFKFFALSSITSTRHLWASFEPFHFISFCVCVCVILR
eukprot:m.61170 g.61170  ORF g.61170 m.61170 type:complete len:71 (-) comp11849_c1_seq2:685-897(-)